MPLCLGILHVGSFIKSEFSLHLLQMSNMNYRGNPCKGNHLNPASIHKYFTHVVLRQNKLMLRGSFIVVLKDTFCEHTLTKIALKPYIFMSICCQMQWQSLVTVQLSH